MSAINPFTNRVKTLDDVADLTEWGRPAVEILHQRMQCDPGHDEGHIVRVVRNAMWFGMGGDLNIIVPAAILHDLVNLPKDSPFRNQASLQSAIKATGLLKARLPFKDDSQALGIFHAIEAHSWSANLIPTTIEAKAVQDADRLDSLGHIGIARLFAVGGSMGRSLFHPTDPMALDRELDELTYTLDHFFVKLNKLEGTMQTSMGQTVAGWHTKKMLRFIESLIEEL